MSDATSAQFVPADEAAPLHQAILALDNQRPLLGDAVVEAAIAAMRERLAALEAAALDERRRKQVTVLFGDIVGFTALSEGRDAEIVAQVINTLWEGVDVAVLTQGGRIDKHIGDAIIAVWGGEVAREDDPERALHAALAMHAATDACCRLYNVPISLRVGIHTGPALTGAVGAGGETTVVGETVSLADRLQHVAPAGGTLISRDTYRHVRGIFDVQPAERAAAALGLPAAYVVKAAKPRAFRVAARGIEGVETRMVGREAELSALQEAFTAVVAERRPRLLAIIGEAGIGKSRLLYEFDNWVELRPEEAFYYKGRAAASAAATAGANPFGLFHDLFANRFEILDSDPPEVALGKFRAGFARAYAAQESAPAEGEAEAVTDAADLVGQWLGFDFDSSPAVARLLGSPEFGRAARAYLLRYFRAHAAVDPLVILCEDLHWADSASLDLIDDLYGSLRDAAPGAVVPAPVLIIAAGRPSLLERHPAWAGDAAGVNLLRLDALPPAQTQALVDEALQRVPQLPDRLRQRITDIAGGNPFYVEELVKMYIEQGVIARGATDDAPWAVALDRLDAVRVPPTLVGLIQARLDALPAAERRTLQHAAVVGRVFWDSALAALAGAVAPPPLTTALGRELVLRRAPSAFAGCEEFLFRHALVRDVAYETVLLSERRALHARAARWLEAHAAERIDECLSVLAGHWGAANDAARAAGYLVRSAELALAAGNHGAASATLRRALELTAPSTATLLLLGEAAFMISDLPTAGDALEQALTLARATGDHAAEANSLYWHSRVATARGDFDAARAALEEALPIARAVGGATLARALEGLAGAVGSRGDLPTAAALGNEALALAREVGDRTLEMRCLALLGTFARLGDDLDAAEARFDEARALAHRAGNLEREATALLNLGDLAYRRERYDEARANAHAALDLFRDQGLPDAVAIAAGNLAQAELMLGERDAATADARQALAAARAAGATPLVLFALSVFAQAVAPADRPRAAALLRLVIHHPATEYQDRREAAELLTQLGASASAPAAPLELDAAIAAVLDEAVAGR